MMKGLNVCVCTVLGILGLLLSFSVSTGTTCSPTCLEPPQPGNDTALACNGTQSACNDTGLSCNGTESACNATGLSCNETTRECLYGCREGFGGERCQFMCANNCTNCTVSRCDDHCTASCDNTTCSQTEACIDGCRDGLYGQNCSLVCPAHCLNSSCDRENGTCLLGCEGEHFGDTCELSCSPNCANLDNDTSLTCNETTLACLHGCVGNFEGDKCDRCKREWVGPQCNTKCDYNCQNCTWDKSSGEIGCDLCRPEYYYFNKRCEQCRSTCLKNASSELPTCDMIDGTCNFGCTNGWYTDDCNAQCGPLCVNKTCSRQQGCCTVGCKYDNKGGCNCQIPCNSNCEGGTCYQNQTCTQGCKLNTWGPDCSQSCNVNCEDASNNTLATCDRNGTCLYGCKKTFMGQRCSKSCPANCADNDCNATSGHCLKGCEKDYWKERCDTNCSTNCLQSNVTTCYQDNGTCVQGCIVDKRGPFCAQNCPDNCLNKTCHRYNGTCSLGCEKGFTGENCSTQIPPTTDKPGINPTAIAATAGGSGGGLLALVIVALILRHRYIVFKEEAEMKEVNRKTRGGIEDLRKKRNDNRKSRLAVGVFNPGYDKIPRKKSDEEDEAVLAVDTLLDHVMNINIDGFSDEFQKLPANVVKHEKQKKKSSSKGSKKVKFNTTTASNSLTNQIDWDGPVQIENIIIDNLVNESTERTYNASKIEVYSRKYIAAEGPSFSSSVDFWLMAWSTSSPVIVMLTPTSINKQSASVRYWPENGKKEIYGHITITNVREDTFANFVSRELKVEKNGETRVLRQVQLNLWTDDKKFPNIADLIDFYMYFRAITTADPEPVLAHCSDGESRTGVFIALDLLVRDGEKFGLISVLDCVRTLREQRDNMVQNKEHYQFLYSLVAQTLQLRCKPVQEKDFVESFKKSNEALESNPLMTPLEDAYENMRAAIVMKPVDEESIKRQWNLKMKNREGADIPEDHYRPSLPGGLYINAVYIDTLRKKDLITTQMPLPKTVEDFYKLVAAEKCHVVVMLNSTKTMDKTQGVYWPKKGKTVKHGNICASLDDTAKTDDYKQLSLTLSDYSRKACCKRNETEEEHRVTLFQLKHWKTGPRPSNSVSMLRLIRAVKAERGEYEDGPVVVHCLNGSERSGVFCALYELTEAIEKGLAFSVVNTVYKIKYRRPSAILNLDQFKFLHEALEIFITSEEFRGEPVQTAAPMIQADAED